MATPIKPIPIQKDFHDMPPPIMTVMNIPSVMTPGSM